jgi:Recombinase/Recombinase zinc beta ribbon domain
MSEAELHVLKARLQGGIRNKARRGELELPLPIGLVYGADGSVALDPDRQIQDTIRLLFDTFRECSSASAVVRRFRHESWRFPRCVRRGVGKGDVLWGTLDHSRVLQILHNPRYAGAFVYGRTRTSRNAHTLKSMLRKVARENWNVLIPDAHAGYITWQEYERNQVILKQNTGGFGVAARGSMPREGVGLLQGRVVCGHCGARMRVRYQEVERRLEPYYQCSEAVVRHAGKLCQSVRGRPVDEAVSALLLESVAPAALEVALAVQDEIVQRIEEAEALRRTRLERVRYDAELARRRYLKVDPDNRMVADALEADWNAQLRQLDALQREHERQRLADQGLLSEEARARILSLAHDFRRIWNDPRTAPIERKRMVALLIEDVTLVKADRIAIHIRFRGGRTASLTIDKPKLIALVRKTPPEVVRRVDELLETCTDRQVAAQLDEQGYRNWRGQTFTIKKVILIRRAYRLKSRFQRLRERGMLTGDELAKQLRVCITTVHHWGRAGLLRRHLYGNNHRCLYEPVGDVTVIKGAGGHYGSRPPKFIAASSTTQGAI